MQIKGAIFDMDGILFDTEMLYQKFWREIAGERGVELDESFTFAISGTSGEEMKNVIMHHYHVDDPAVALEIEVDCKRRVDQSLEESVPEKKGVHEILAYLRKKDFKIAIASSSSRHQIRHNIQTAGVEEYFDVLVSGSEVENGKPAPDIFREAASRLGLAAEECFVFEDSRNGVAAGHAAKCYTVMIPDVVQPTEETKANANLICKDFLEVIEELEKM